MAAADLVAHDARGAPVRVGRVEQDPGHLAEGLARTPLAQAARRDDEAVDLPCEQRPDGLLVLLAPPGVHDEQQVVRFRGPDRRARDHAAAVGARGHVGDDAEQMGPPVAQAAGDPVGPVAQPLRGRPHRVLVLRGDHAVGPAVEHERDRAARDAGGPGHVVGGDPAVRRRGPPGSRCRAHHLS